MITAEWQVGDVSQEIVERIKAGPLGPDEFPDWTADPNYKRAFLYLLEEKVESIKFKSEVPERWSGEGRGIVISASCKSGWSSGKLLQHGYMPSAYALMSELRRLGCDLPITVAYLGYEEMDHNICSLIKSEFGAEAIDLRHISDTSDPMRILAGWETKIYAIQHSPYEEVLFLDSDNTPVKNPEYLFDLKGHVECGATFWPDLPPYTKKEWLPREVWDSVGLPYRNNYIDFESGQLIVNKRKCWKPLEIVRFINEHSDYWYKLVFGDKSTFFLGFHKMDYPYAITPEMAGWNKKAILQHDLDGKLIFQHCVQDKATLQGYKETGYLVHEAECFEAVCDLRRKWDGNLWHITTGDEKDENLLKQYSGTWEYCREDAKPRQLVLHSNGQIGRGRARCEAQWRVFDHPDGRRLIVIYDAEDVPIMVGCMNEDMSFSGKWIQFEKNMFTMKPVSCVELGMRKLTRQEIRINQLNGASSSGRD